jgi:hypothetical protein
MTRHLIVPIYFPSYSEVLMRTAGRWATELGADVVLQL